MQSNGSIWIFVLYVIVTILTLIISILTSFMITSAGTKEHNWWIFLMCVSWVSFACSAAVSGFSGYGLFKGLRAGRSVSNSTVTVNIPSVPEQPQPQAPDMQAPPISD